jgi:hypothetical protein
LQKYSRGASDRENEVASAPGARQAQKEWRTSGLSENAALEESERQKQHKRRPEGEADRQNEIIGAIRRQKAVAQIDARANADQSEYAVGGGSEPGVLDDGVDYEPDDYASDEHHEQEKRKFSGRKLVYVRHPGN